MSNSYRTDPSKDEIRLIPCDSTQGTSSMNTFNPNANNAYSSPCNNGIIVPVLVNTMPRKVIVPINHVSQSVVTSNGQAQPPIKRFSNGETKNTFSYRAMPTENTIINQQERVLINTNTQHNVTKSPVGFHFQNSTIPQGSIISLICPNCKGTTRQLTPCDVCKKTYSPISVIRQARMPQPKSVLCATNTLPVGAITTRVNTIAGSNVRIPYSSTVVKAVAGGRTRPSIISGSRPNVSAISPQTFFSEKMARAQEGSPSTLTGHGVGLQQFVVNHSSYLPEPRPPIHTLIPVTLAKPTRPRKQQPKHTEPECLTISSDDEDVTSSQTPVIKSEVVSGTDDDSVSSPQKSQSQQKDDEDDSKLKSNEGVGERTTDSGGCSPPADEVSTSGVEPGIHLMCRSIRIGSYKIQSPDPPSLMLDITNSVISFSVPQVTNDKEFVKIDIIRDELASIMVCFEKRLFVLFLYTTPECGTKIRNKLKMKLDSVYYDPTSLDDTKKRIVILPGNITDIEKAYLRRVFMKPKIVELGQVKANEILVRSTPAGGNQHMVRLSAAAPVTRSKSEAESVTAIKNEVKNLCTYPPPPQTGGITITTEDILCLEKEEYLNDAIIDFYLKYIYYEKLSTEDQKKTYIFSSFFFNRLSTVPTKNTPKKDPKIGPKESRHARVKNWTRHVDIFDKDYLIVPINQSSHWFLVIICFPGKVDGNYKPIVKEKKMTKTQLNSAAKDDIQNQLEENASSTSEKSTEDMGDPENPLPPVKSLVPYPLDDPMEVEEEIKNPNEASVTSTSTDNESPSKTDSDHSYSTVKSILKKDKANKKENTIETDDEKKRPCIIVFDSLPGTSRWRVVNYLREYLEVEHVVKKASLKHFDRESMKGLNARVARQENFSDCGIYLLQYAESFFQSPLESFSMPLKDLRDWFPIEIVNNKRDEIKKLILELSKPKKPLNSVEL